MKKPPILSRYPRSEPNRATWSFPHQIKLTFGRRSRRLHQYPACGGWGSKGRDHSSIRLFGHMVVRFVRPDRPEMIRFWKI